MEHDFYTQRLRLRSLRPTDDAAMTVAANDFGVAKWLTGMPYPYRLDDARAFISTQLEKTSASRAVFQGGQFLGMIGAQPNFGYWYGRHAWGHGVASEAGTAYLAEHFSCGGGDLSSGYLEGNIPSARVLDKLGFRQKGTRVEMTKLRGPVSHHLMELTRANWLAQHGLPIKTARLILRPLVSDDWRAVAQLGGNPCIAKMMGSIKTPWQEADVKDWINRARFRGRVGFRLGVCLTDGTLIGVVGLGGVRQPSVSYFIGQNFKGRGYGQEALRAILAYGFEQFDLPMITSDVFTDNPASIHMLEKAGFEKCGQEMAESQARVEPHSVFLYRLTRDLYQSRQP